MNKYPIFHFRLKAKKSMHFKIKERHASEVHTCNAY